METPPTVPGEEMNPRHLVLACLLVVGALIWYLMRSYLSLDRLVESERQLRGFIQAYPWRAFALGFSTYVVVSLFPGTSGKSVVVGWFFGFWPALVMVTVALTIAAMCGFFVARILLSHTLRTRFAIPLARFDRAVQREGVYYLLTVRLLHVPYTLVNYASGVTGIRPWTFAWTTLAGLVPSTMVFVGLGAGLPSLEELHDRGAMSLVSPAVVVALVAMGAVPWVVRSVIRRLGIGGVDPDHGLRQGLPAVPKGRP